MEKKIKISGTAIEVFLCIDGDWRHDTIFIQNKKLISKREIRAIVQYLYDEGYIKDRRTKYYLSVIL